MGSVASIGWAVMPVTGSPRSFCARPVYNSMSIRGSDGRLVSRDLRTSGGGAWVFHPDSATLAADQSLVILTPGANDEALPISPCDTLGTLIDLKLNPTNWTNLHRCSPSSPEWYDVDGKLVTNHDLFGYANGFFDHRGSTSLEVTDGNGTVRTFDPAKLEGGQFTREMVRALPDGFLIITDDGVPRPDTSFPTLLALWKLGFDGVAQKLGTYGDLPADFRPDPGGVSRAMNITGTVYLVGLLPGASYGVIELPPDGSTPTVIYDRDALDASMGSQDYWVRLSAPRHLFTGP